MAGRAPGRAGSRRARGGIERLTSRLPAPISLRWRLGLPVDKPRRGVLLHAIKETAIMAYALRIVHLYPEQMNIYGDRGNILALTQRCAWRGIAVDLLPVGVGAEVDWEAVDVAFFGGGQDSGQALIAADFVE